MNSKKVLAIVFSIILIALPLMTAFSKKQAFSESENRNLATFPEFSVSSIFDKTFMNGFDSYVSDHFIGRDAWVSLKSKLELLTLKRENNSIILTNNKTLVENLKEPEKRKVAQNIDGILTFAENNKDAKIFAAIAPTSCDIYSDSLPYGKDTWSQKKVIDEFYDAVSDKAYGIDIYSTLKTNRNQYIYYNSDHHWTSLGAYYAYSQIASALDFKPYNKSSFDIESVSHEFLGTYSSKSKIDVPADTIDLYSLASFSNDVPEVTINDGKKETVHKGLYFREWLDKKDKYSVFLGTQQPEVTIKTNVKNDKKLLIFKDSFAHSLVPFLALHYSEIKLVDLRYTNDWKSIVDASEYDDVLLLYNIESLTQSSDISKLAD